MLWYIPMKKILLVIFLILGLVVSMIPPLFASDHPSNSPVNTGVKSDLPSRADADLESPGILPTNPFYFIKEWGRGLRRALTFNAASKVAYELGVADQKLAELQKLANLSQNNEAIKTALSNYNDSLRILSASVKALEEYSGSADADKAYGNLSTTLNRHQITVNSMKGKYDGMVYHFSVSEEILQSLFALTPESSLRSLKIQKNSK